MMKKVLVGVIFSLFLFACSPSELPGGQQTTPTASQPPTETRQPTLSATLSATPSPTAAIFVRDGTPLPPVSEAISVENVGRIAELARLGPGRIEAVVLSQDKEILYVQTSIALTAYDAASKNILWRFEPGPGMSVFALHEASKLIAAGDNRGNIYLLRSSSGETEHTWLGHKGAVEGLAFSREGDHLVSGRNSDAAVWLIPEIELAYRLYPESVWGMEISKNRLIVSDHIYDLHSGNLTYFDGGEKIIEVFSEAGLFLVGKNAHVSLRNLNDGEEITRFDIRDDKTGSPYLALPVSAAISDDFSQLALARAWELQVGIWDIATGEMLHDLVIPYGVDRHFPVTQCAGDGPGPFIVYEMDFSDDGRELAVVSGFDEVDYWDLETGNLLRSTVPTYDPLSQPPSSPEIGDTLAVSPDGNWVASGGYLWELGTGGTNYYPDQSIVGFTSDSSLMYSYKDKSILVYTPGDAIERRRYVLGAESLDDCGFIRYISADGGLFYEAGAVGDSHFSFLWELTAEVHEWFELAFIDEHRSVTFSPKGNLLILVRGSEDGSRGSSRDIVVYELATGTEMFSISIKQDNWISDAVVAASENTLAALGDELILVWDLSEPERAPQEFPLEGLTYMQQLAVAPDGMMVAGSSGGSIRIWDTRTGELLNTIYLYHRVYDLSFSDDGRFLAAVTGAGVLTLWGIPE